MKKNIFVTAELAHTGVKVKSKGNSILEVSMHMPSLEEFKPLSAYVECQFADTWVYFNCFQKCSLDG